MTPLLPKSRLEAFSDGVLAIVITIMVLEMKAPHTAEGAIPAIHDLAPVLPKFVAYVLSFVYVGIYWSNHHHLLHATRSVTGGTLWANLHLLFWLSLIPFTTSWMGECGFESIPVALYGLNLLGCAGSWDILRRLLIRHHPPDSELVRAIKQGSKEWISLSLYVSGLLCSLLLDGEGGHGGHGRWIALFLFAVVAAIWLVPDRRIERALASH